jgi:uncharacterized membrane protein
MSALRRLPPEQGIAAMQSINVTVLNPEFLLAFLGTGVVCAALAGASYFWWGQTSAILILVASLTYIVGCVGVTMVCNVPLNDALGAVRAETLEAATLWSRYLKVWTAWNHVRAMASIASTILFTIALIKLRSGR